MQFFSSLNLLLRFCNGIVAIPDCCTHANRHDGRLRLAGCILISVFVGVSASADEQTAFEDLIGNDVTQHWKHFHSDAEVPLTAVWKVVTLPTESTPESVLICVGNPKGFLITNEVFEDFELTLEWKYPTDANGNSGVLVYAQDEPRIWPTSIQVQFHQPKAGSVFPSGDATSDNKIEVDELARPVNTWNECKIVSRSGTLSVTVNGRKPIEITGAKPKSGRKCGWRSSVNQVHKPAQTADEVSCSAIRVRV